MHPTMTSVTSQAQQRNGIQIVFWTQTKADSSAKYSCLMWFEGCWFVFYLITLFQQFQHLRCFSTYGRRAFAVAGPSVWNSLPDSLRDPAVGSDSFRRSLKTFLFATYWDMQRIRGSTRMRYTNLLLLTYLLSYLLIRASVHTDSLLQHFIKYVAVVTDRCREGYKHECVWPCFYYPASISFCISLPLFIYFSPSLCTAFR